MAREESVPGFKALLLGVNAAGDFKLKPMLIWHSQDPKALKNYTLTYLYKWNSKAWLAAHLCTTWFTESKVN